MASTSLDRKPRALHALDVVSALLMAATLYMVFFYAPTERVMGQVQRLFYFHVSSAWVAMAVLIVAAVLGIVYLIRPQHKLDVWAVACIELGLVYAFICVTTGSIWARPAWNTWWTWDPRVVTFTILILVYLAYMLLRQGIEDPQRRARFGAIYAILASVTVPLTYFSIRIWRTLHPVVIGSGDPSAQGTFDMTRPMLHTLLFSLLAFSVFGATLLWHRVRLGWLADKVEQLRMQALGR
ncbi:MAG: cytochrome c biogenesis protein CcsA [Anaerolineales bacterium]|jgi:heme exporter protein C|nr:cytochrome c biogenesis protein CcsA [Anaerolineales bacterium]MBX3005876.1 cytochrome c biogenesis protein CcsA [Anaerolineales bacterium]MCW5838902.1 cytochrome c biogenesis protein CcsA [Anaerolineales bacterium]MCW5887205.1 cytochrome c biogenesis protein CcsA [Anaerolineales bacterium]